MTIKSPDHVIAGLGKTGFACAKFLWERQIPFAITDTRENPPYLQQFREQFPHVITKVGGLDQELLVNAKEIIVTAPHTPHLFITGSGATQYPAGGRS